ncbi:tagaturonate epimerase family protein [Virgibacillus natechei]|uniref:tagaturonate epimerase family protein n=1 Tax=Virgibacillus sp. CBA3643 TaxID=2942278 RepID=UPI0035A33870
MDHLLPVLDSLKQGEINTDNATVKIYESSFVKYDRVFLLMLKDKSSKWLLVAGNGILYDELNGTTLGKNGKVCPLSHENRLILNRYFDYTVPQAFGTEVATMGLGDRLGLASPGHIQTVKGRKVKPILAQQSIRELNLTGRTMNDILDAASFAVLQEGYKGGFGADGDHLKEESDIQHALSLGMSMLTLDCSDYIQNRIERASTEEIRDEYEKLPQEMKSHYNESYLNKTIDVNGVSISFDKNELMKNALIYGEAISYMVHVYKKYIRPETRDIDFEISIDETETITSPAEHFFVANELKLKGVEVTSLAPRFCGEFQKGIDYIGDIKRFEHELEEHALIADYLGYKLSIHSGSDKFKVFPIISKYTSGVFHIKTAGTNWLEAVRVIAKTNPDLYRRMHTFALEHFEETLKYYHVTPDLNSIAKLDSVKDNELENYMNNDAARQLFHVTYGLILTAKNNKGQFLFRDEFFEALNDKEEDYEEALINHIGRHIDTLSL